MKNVCVTSTTLTKTWFENLAGIRDKMADLNHMTKDNVKEFSHQSLEELFMPDAPGLEQRKGAFKLYCETKLEFIVPSSAFDNMSKDFLRFLGELIGVPADARLHQLFQCVAKKFSSDKLPEDVGKFIKMRLREAFADIPFENNPGLQALDRLMRYSVNPSFYHDESPLRAREMTVQDTVALVLG